MTTSETVLDYGLVDKSDEGLVSSFIIDENNRYGISSDHSTIFMSIRMDGPISKVRWFVQDKWCTIKDDTDWPRYADSTDRLCMDDVTFEKLGAEEKLNHLREVLKKGWLKSGMKENRGGGRSKKGDNARKRVKKLELELFLLKKRGQEGSEEFRRIALRIEDIIQNDKKEKREFKEKKERENDELFIKSDPNGMRFFDFIRLVLNRYINNSKRPFCPKKKKGEVHDFISYK